MTDAECISSVFDLCFIRGPIQRVGIRGSDDSLCE